MNPKNNSLLAQHRYQTNILNELGISQWVHNDSRVIELSEFLSNLPEQQTFDASDIKETQEIEVSQKTQIETATPESGFIADNQENQQQNHPKNHQENQVNIQEQPELVQAVVANGNDSALEASVESDEKIKTSEQFLSERFDLFFANNNQQFEINGLVIPINGKQVVLAYSSDIDEIQNAQSQLWESFLNAVKLQSNIDGFNAVKYTFPMMQHIDTHTLENAKAGLAGWVTSIRQESNLPIQLFWMSLNEASIPLDILKEAVSSFELNLQVKALPSINEMLQDWQAKRSAWEAIVAKT